MPWTTARWDTGELEAAVAAQGVHMLAADNTANQTQESL